MFRKMLNPSIPTKNLMFQGPPHWNMLVQWSSALSLKYHTNTTDQQYQLIFVVILYLTACNIIKMEIALILTSKLPVNLYQFYKGVPRCQYFEQRSIKSIKMEIALILTSKLPVNLYQFYKGVPRCQYFEQRSRHVSYLAP